MMNIMSYAGMTMQAEVCLWTLLGILRTVFDATLFKVNANLKQVWQMTMPAELSMPVQRALRTMISGIMLVQCFTVYVYLATYIVLLYPVFLLWIRTCFCIHDVQEERPTLVLPWLLLAAVRKLLCELLSLALGLGTCLLVGPARPPCIKFVVVKVVSIMPSFYMWMLVFSYYSTLKLAAAFKTFPAAPAHDLDYGLELAIRRRRTKSLFNEHMLRTRLITDLYAENQVEKVPKPMTPPDNVGNVSPSEISEAHSNEAHENIKEEEESNALRYQNKLDVSEACQTSTYRILSDVRTSDDWYGSEITVPRDTDRITEQFCLMLLRIGVYLKTMGENGRSIIFGSDSILNIPKSRNCPNLTDGDEATVTPPLTASSKGNVASYLREYPHIFMRKTSDLQIELKLDNIKNVQSQIDGNFENKPTVTRQILTTESEEIITPLGENKSQKKIKILEADLKQEASFESRDSKQLQQLREANEDKDQYKREVVPQNNVKQKDNSDTAVSSSDSLSSIIARMKSHLKEARTSRTATTSRCLNSSRDLNNEQNKNRKSKDKKSDMKRGEK